MKNRFNFIFVIMLTANYMAYLHVYIWGKNTMFIQFSILLKVELKRHKSSNYNKYGKYFFFFISWSVLKGQRNVWLNKAQSAGLSAEVLRLWLPHIATPVLYSVHYWVAKEPYSEQMIDLKETTIRKGNCVIWEMTYYSHDIYCTDMF